MKQKILFIVIISFMLLLILFPSVCINGTKNGLILWYKSILPSLLPYMLLSNYLINTDVFRSMKTKNKFLSINILPATFVGIFCGYPMGAYFTAKSYSQCYLRKTTAYWLISFVNLCSPAFIIEYIVIEKLNGLFLKEILISIYLGALLTALILFPIYYKKQKNDIATEEALAMQIDKKDFTECILDTFMQLIKLCAYIVLFSITLNMVTAFSKAVTIKHIILIGLMELTNGISYASAVIDNIQIKLMLITLFVSFGSLSCIFQTSSVIKNSGLKVYPYVFAKILNAGISTTIMYILINSIKGI